MTEVRALLLAAGKGSRLRPLTDRWPKCLMLISGRPLLEYWLCTLAMEGISDVVVNVHHHSSRVEEFLTRKRFRDWVIGVYEPELLGTAGTLLKTSEQPFRKTTLLIHADNWCQCDFSAFLEYHFNSRPDNTVMTMMTFQTPTPETCGIVELDKNGVVQQLHEKVKHPPGNLANGAVYLLEPECLQWLNLYPDNKDFSTDVLPHFVGRIATWKNNEIHRDIGSINALRRAQSDPLPEPCWPEIDLWQEEFERSSTFINLNEALHIG